MKSSPKLPDRPGKLDFSTYKSRLFQVGDLGRVHKSDWSQKVWEKPKCLLDPSIRLKDDFVDGFLVPRIPENETEALVAGDNGWSVESRLRGVPE